MANGLILQGVSNFNIIKLKRLIEVCGVPAANQIEMNPYAFS